MALRLRFPLVESDLGHDSTADDVTVYGQLVEDTIDELFPNSRISIDYGVDGATSLFADSDEEEELARDVLADLWDEWCRQDGNAKATFETVIARFHQPAARVLQALATIETR